MLRCHNVSVRFGEISALAGASLDVAAGEVVAVVGPSGSGKSTLLRVIAGLQAPDAGSVVWDGTDVTHLPAFERGFGLMFQDYALFPHRNVAGNIAFGLEMANADPLSIATRVAELLQLVGLEGYGDRRVAELSGGEQQRVALARTLAPEPGLVMLDEPIGALDRALREELIGELANIFSRLDAAVIYVTHDQDEAFGVADRVAVMNQGRVVALDAPQALWHQPSSEFVATFLGMRVVDATVRNGVADFGWAEVAVGGEDGERRFVVPPTAVTPKASGQIRGHVTSCRYRAGSYVITVEVARDVEIVAASDERHGPGSAVRLSLSGERIVPVAQSTSSDV